VNHISSDLANKYYSNILDIHRMDTEYYIKVTILECILEAMLALPELAGEYNETQKQKKWLDTNKEDRRGRKVISGFIPEAVADDLKAIYGYRDKGYHEKSMVYGTYFGKFNVMAQAISLFSNTPIPPEIKDICDGNDAAKAPNSNRNHPTTPMKKATQTYKIGDRGPGGGTVFYVEGGKYMECSGELGLYCWDTAVTAAKGYDGGGFSDWRLPTKNELDLMYVNLKTRGLGGFDDDWYWSSSQHDSNYAWLQNFNDGNQLNYIKNVSYSVRAVRAF